MSRDHLLGFSRTVSITREKKKKKGRKTIVAAKQTNTLKTQEPLAFSLALSPIRLSFWDLQPPKSKTNGDGSTRSRSKPSRRTTWGRDSIPRNLFRFLFLFLFLLIQPNQPVQISLRNSTISLFTFFNWKLCLILFVCYDWNWCRMSLEERYQIVRSIGEECIQEDELRNLLEKKPEPICYDGFEPSGRMHIAQVTTAFFYSYQCLFNYNFYIWVIRWAMCINGLVIKSPLVLKV